MKKLLCVVIVALLLMAGSCDDNTGSGPNTDLGTDGGHCYYYPDGTYTMLICD